MGLVSLQLPKQPWVRTLDKASLWRTTLRQLTAWLAWHIQPFCLQSPSAETNGLLSHALYLQIYHVFSCSDGAAGQDSEETVGYASNLLTVFALVRRPCAIFLILILVYAFAIPLWTRQLNITVDTLWVAFNRPMTVWPLCWLFSQSFRPSAPFALSVFNRNYAINPAMLLVEKPKPV